MPGKLVLFVEGKGDVASVPTVAQRVLQEIRGYDALVLDRTAPFRTPLPKLVKDDGREWKRLLQQAGRTRRPTSAILVVLDGDTKRVPPTWHSYISKYGNPFCAARAAAVLAKQAREERAGEAYSLAVVFVMQEFETWLAAGIQGLSGLDLPENRGRIPDDAKPPEGDLELNRNAKGILGRLIRGYQPTLDQAALASHFDMLQASDRCRSFRRFKSAISQLTNAVREGHHIVSPI